MLRRSIMKTIENNYSTYGKVQYIKEKKKLKLKEKKRERMCLKRTNISKYSIQRWQIEIFSQRQANVYILIAKNFFKEILKKVYTYKLNCCICLIDNNSIILNCFTVTIHFLKAL